jgi:hypothetical protein
MWYADHVCNCLEDGDNYIYSGGCHYCKSDVIVVVPKQAIRNYRAGALIQQAMPMLSKGQREFLISGVCNECFDKL